MERHKITALAHEPARAREHATAAIAEEIEIVENVEHLLLDLPRYRSVRLAG